MSSSDAHSPLENNLNGNTAVNIPSSSAFLCTSISDASDSNTMTAAPFFNSTSAVTAAQLLNPSNVEAARSLASVYAASVQQQQQQQQQNASSTNNATTGAANNNNNNNSNPTAQLTNPTLLVNQTTAPIVFPPDLNESLQRIFLTSRGPGCTLGELFFPPTAPQPPTVASPMINCFSSIPADLKSKLNQLPNFLSSLISGNPGNLNPTSVLSTVTAAAAAGSNANSSLPVASAITDQFIAVSAT